MLRATSRTVHRARALRRQMTLPEVLLWQELRKRPGGFKFRKQHPAGEYVLDFFCAEVSLCIEVDGTHHDGGDQPEFDSSRDRRLALHGIATLRLNAADVLGDLEAVVALVVSTSCSRLPLHHSAAPSGPPPRAGEEFEGAIR